MLFGLRCYRRIDALQYERRSAESSNDKQKTQCKGSLDCYTSYEEEVINFNSFEKVSVITPSYNCRSTLLSVIESVREQGTVVLEHIIVDDGSNDGTYELIDELRESRNYKHIKVVRQVNSGEASAVNHGFELSRGEFVLIVNADDPLLRDCIYKLLSVLSCSPDVVVAYPDWKMIGEDGETLRKIYTLDFKIQSLIGDLVCVVGPAGLIRRSAVKGKFLRDQKYTYLGDYEMWMRLSLQGGFTRVPEILATWRKTNGNATSRGRGKDISQEYFRLNRDFFNRSDLLPEVKKLERRALAHTYYYAGIQKLFCPELAGRRQVIRSWIMWPVAFSKNRSIKRSKLISIAVIFYPVPLLIARILYFFNVPLPEIAKDALLSQKADIVSLKHN